MGLFTSKKKREEAQRQAEQEARERAAREEAARQAQAEAAKREADEARAAAAKKIYEKAESAFFGDRVIDSERLYQEAFEQGYYPAGSLLHFAYMDYAEGKSRDIPFYNKSAVDQCYHEAYRWALRTLQAAFKQSRANRGSEYEKKLFGDDTECTMQNARLELAKMDLYRQGPGAGPEEAVKKLAYAGEWGKAIEDEVEEGRNAEYFIGLIKNGLWEPGTPLPNPLPEGISEYGLYYAAVSFREGIWSEKNPEMAFRLFKDLSDIGYFVGIYGLAECYEKGIGTPPDPEKALNLYVSASGVDRGYEIWAGCAKAFVRAGQHEEWVKETIGQLRQIHYAPAMFVYAMMLERGFGAEKNPKEALSVMLDDSTLHSLYSSDRKKHTNYIPEVMDFLTEHFRTELREGRNPRFLYEWATGHIFNFEREGHIEENIAILTALLDTPYREKAEKALYSFYTYSSRNQIQTELRFVSGNANYCIFYRTTKIPEEAFRLGLAFAENGDARAMYQTGIRYCRGIGTEKDPEKAEFWLTKALENGAVGAKTALACMGEPEDLLANNAAINAHKENHLERAYALHLGRDLTFDEGKALKELELAADAGNVEALEHLMNFYLTGPALFRSRGTAFKYAKRAGEAGSGRGYRLCAQTCESGGLADSKYALEYYQMAAALGDAESAEQVRRLTLEQAQNYEKGMEAFRNGKYYSAYHLWYPLFQAKDERIVLPAAEALSHFQMPDQDDFACWAFTRAYELGETRYAKNAARAYWFSPGHFSPNRVIEWFLRAPSLTGDDYYILAQACKRAGRGTEYLKYLDQAVAGECYMAQYDYAQYYIAQNDRSGYYMAEALAKLAEANPNKHDPSVTGYFCPETDELFSRLRKMNETLTEQESAESERRWAAFEQEQLAIRQRAAAANASSVSPGSPFGDPFKKYGLTDDDGNTYTYDPATGRLTGANIDGAISLSPDEMRRRAAEHSLTQIIDDFINQ